MMPDGVAGRIVQFNQGRRPDTLALKYAKLRKNAFFFFRGTAHLFYQNASPPAVVAGAPQKSSGTAQARPNLRR